MAELLAIAAPVVRGLILATLLLLTGTVFAGALIDRTDLDRQGAASAVIEGWLGRLPGLLAWFLLTLSLLRGAVQVLLFTDPGAPVDPELARLVLSSGSWGAGWLSQTLIAFILLALSWLLRHARARMRWTFAAGSLALLLAQSGMGHGVDPFWAPAVLGRLVHLGHLLGGALWLGTLGVLALAVFPSLTASAERPALATVLAHYSRLARTGALLIVASGVVAAWTYTTALSDLWRTDWGKLLLLKLVLLMGVAALGFWNWRVLTPRLAGGDPPAASQLRRAVAIELALGGLLIAVTAVLVGVGTPREF